MTAWDLIDILSSKPFYVHILNMKAKPGRLPKFILVAYASMVQHASATPGIMNRTGSRLRATFRRNETMELPTLP